MNGVVPLHVPFAAVSVAPSWAVPEIDGAVVLTGALRADTTALGSDSAFAVPLPFVAVTRTRSVEPTSPLATV